MKNTIILYLIANLVALGSAITSPNLEYHEVLVNILLVNILYKLEVVSRCMNTGKNGQSGASSSD